jgi:hypothetical protein
MSNPPERGSTGGMVDTENMEFIRTDDLTVDEIVELIRDYDGGIYGQPNFASGDYYKEIPYYKQVLEDVSNGDFSSKVTQKVVEYANYLKEYPESIADLPPLMIIDGGFADGSHRVSAIHLLNNLLDIDNPQWDGIKLRVNFYQSITESYTESIPDSDNFPIR